MGDATSNANKARREAEPYLRQKGWKEVSGPGGGHIVWTDPVTSRTHYFDDAWDIQYARDEAAAKPQPADPALPVREFAEGEFYVVLCTSKDAKALKRFLDPFLREMFGGEWLDHLDDVEVHVSHDSALVVRQEIWNQLTLTRRHSLYGRAQGFVDGLDE